MSIRVVSRAFAIIAVPVFLALGYVVSGQNQEDSLLVRARELRLNEVYFDSARLYRAYLAGNPDDFKARIELGDLLLLLDDPVDAANQVIPVLKADKENAEAEAIFEESLDRIEEGMDPNNPTGFLQIARLKRFSGDEEEAQQFYIQYIQVVPNDSLALHELAQMVYDGGDPERGLALLQEAIDVADEEETRRELLLKQASWLSYDEETSDEAVVAFEALIEEYPEMGQAHLLLADLYRYRGEYDKSADSYLMAINTGGDNERATEGYFLVLLQTRALQSARKAKIEENYKEAVELYELHFQEMDLTRAKLEQIQRLEAQGRANPSQQRAAVFFQRFLEATPDEAEIRLEAAESYSQIGDIDNAIVQLEKAIELRPENRDARYRLAQYQTFSAETVDAAGLTLDSMIEDFGPDAEVATLRGDVYRFQGEFVEAKKAYQEILKKNPDDPVALAGMEAIENAFSPGFFGGIGFIRDWSSDFDHFYFGLGLRNIFSAIQHRLNLEVNAQYFRQPISTQNQQLSNNQEDVAGAEVMFTMGGPLDEPWSYVVSLGGEFYNNGVDWTPVGRIGLGYGGEQFTAIFGLRRKEAVDDHYNLSALLDEVRMNDLYGQAIYQTEGEEYWKRWQVEGYGETGWFSDGNYRTRLTMALLNRSIEDDEDSLKVGLRGLYSDYKDESPNYFSPSNYYGIGPAIRFDHHFNERTDGGFAASAVWIEQVEEFDIALGGYLYHQITDSARGSLRLDYGQSTFEQGDIRSISGRAEVEILF